MPPPLLTSTLFADLFGTDSMRALFTDQAMIGRYLDVEAALARAQAAAGMIPAEAAEAIIAAATLDNIDLADLAARTGVVGVPIAPLVRQLAAKTAGAHGRWVHYGATTQDIMDTADVLQIRDALDLVNNDLNAIAAALTDLARTHAHTPMAGRTHGQHALPITFGYKAAVWLSGIQRHRRRLAELRPRVEVVQLGGAAGTLASLGEKGPAVRAALARELGLRDSVITWHAMRDGLAEVTGFLAILTGTLGKIGGDIVLLSQSEIGEVSEPPVPGRGSSSTMPQKRNPVGSELMLAAASIVRQAHGLMLDALVHDHERAAGGGWQVEWQALPTAFLAAAGGLRIGSEVLSDLEVYPEAMSRNLEASGGLIMAEAVTMGLAPHIGRQRAHALVSACCRRVEEQGRPFLEVLLEEPEIIGALTGEELQRLLDPRNYLGAVGEMIEATIRLDD